VGALRKLDDVELPVEFATSTSFLNNSSAPNEQSVS
jgi:hypothetical protein